MRKDELCGCFKPFRLDLGSCLLNHGNFAFFRHSLESIGFFFQSGISHYLGHIGSCLSSFLLKYGISM